MQFVHGPESEQANRLAFSKSFSRSVILILIFVSAFFTRLYHITYPPLAFHANRQYRTLLLARAHYFKNIESIPQWRQQIAQSNKPYIKEPPIMEYLAAWGYQLAGQELTWVPRVFAITFWLVGGIFLYLLASKIVPPSGATVSVAFYLFAPFGIFVSRSCQPEALLIMMFLAGLLLIWRYYDRPSTARLLVAATVSALAILIKFITVFPIITVFLLMGLSKRTLRKGLINGQCFCFLLVSLLPALLYYCYLALVPGTMKGVADTILLWHLLFNSFFWKGWLFMMGRTVGYLFIAGGLAGVLLAKDSLTRALLGGLWIGYFIYGLIFTYTTATHDYYQVSIVPIVALSLCPAISLIVTRLERLTHSMRWALAAAGVLLLAGLVTTGLNIRADQFRNLSPNVKDKMDILCQFFGVNPHLIKQINSDFATHIQSAQEIGRLIGHSSKTISLAHLGGNVLAYHGEISRVDWPYCGILRYRKLRGLEKINVEEHFNKLYLKHSPEYFIVTNFKDFEKQPDLKSFLWNKFPVLAQTEDYLIFDLRKSKHSDMPIQK